MFWKTSFLVIGLSGWLFAAEAVTGPATPDPKPEPESRAEPAGNPVGMSAEELLESIAGSRLDGLDDIYLPEGLARTLALPPRIIRSWHIVGPFHFNPNTALAQQQYPPEQGQIDLGASYVGSGGRHVRWTAVEADAAGVLEVREHLDPTEHMMVYALAILETAQPQQVVLGIHSDDGVEAWLNGRKIHSKPGARPLNVEPDKVGTRLAPGKNQLLLKVSNYTGRWAFKAQTLESSAEYDPALHAEVLQALAQAARQGAVPRGDLTRIKSLFDHPQEAVQLGALRLAGLWKLETLRPDLLQVAGAGEAPLILRRAALGSLADLGGPAAIEQLRHLAGPDQAPHIRIPAMLNLARLDLHQAAESASRLLAGNLSETDGTAIFAGFLKRAGGAEALAKAFQTNPPPAKSARFGLRHMRNAGLRNPELREILHVSAGKNQEPREWSEEEREELVAEIETNADPILGEAVFHRAELNCVGCHAIAGAGGFVGPDLARLGTGSTIEHLLQSVLDPDRTIREGFSTVQVVTSGDELHVGIPVRQSDTELVLRTPCREELVLPSGAIQEIKPAPHSLMPEGLANSLTRQELAGLIRFLFELANPDPLEIEAQIMRRWEILAPVPTGLTALAPEEITTNLSDIEGLPWKPAYSWISGDLPFDSFIGSQNPTILFARCQIEVTASGPIRFRLNSADGLSLWVGEILVRAGEETAVDLAEGFHTLLFRVDLEERKDRSLRFELDELPESSGRARVVGGR